MVGVVLLVCAAVGAADQYVGSLTRFWALAWEVPALSAPWLLMPFVVGARQSKALYAGLFGALATLAALIGYGLMTVSPIENAPFTVESFAAFVQSNRIWFVAGTVSGPLFGWLGYRWRCDRDRLAACIAAGAVLLEPVVHSAGIRGLRVSVIPIGPVTATEFVVGMFLGVWFARQRTARGSGRRGS
ncbi:MAG: hypothetical protein QOJ79_1508 [Actinomycetota bacterium]|nr:hypothetical protein [Actinomycetota bacterium]